MTHNERRQRLADSKKARDGTDVRLGKTPSNLFRDRNEVSRQKLLDVKDFNHVLQVDPDNSLIEVEGMTTYEELVDATLPHGVMPAVVPQLKSITIGGAVSGIGIESSSFRYGLPHQSIGEMDVLLASGRDEEQAAADVAEALAAEALAAEQPASHAAAAHAPEPAAKARAWSRCWRP